MSKKQKLELTWIGKDVRPKLEPRILIEDAEKSYCAPTRTSDADIFDNRLIFGDNLLALKALEQEFTGKVKCVYIDPPYNTGNAFEQYNDGLEHSIWLGLLRERLELLYRLLANDGSIWISIDDDEQAYLKVMCDEIFGRANFVATVIWEKKFAPQNDATWLSDSHDFILVYAKNKTAWRPNLLPRTEEMNSRYTNKDNDPRGPWTSGDLSVKTYSASADYPIQTPSGRIINPPAGSCWRVSKEKFEEMVADNRITFGKDGNNVPRIKRFLSEVKGGTVSKTIWFRADVGDNQDAKREVKVFNSESVFATPKPERLIERILTLATQPGDLVLDSFLGSGTTAAVAHKMGRRWIGIELGEHCHTHCIPRLRSVVDGTDQGGITKSVGWKGGGGFRYFKLGPSLIALDKWGRPIIDKEKFNPEALAEAVCKIEGFTYAPSENPEEYWRHGQSSETDFIYVTTQSLTLDYLAKISDDVGPNRTLAIYCSAFLGTGDEFDNLTVKKIPQTLLKKCEWGRDDYSLAVENLPLAQEEPASSKKTTAKRGRKKANADQPTLFAVDGTDENGDA